MKRVPSTLLPKLAGLSTMARSLLLVAYAMADEYGEVRCLLLAGADITGQDRNERRRSIAELVAADIAKYELREGSHANRGWVLTLLEWGE